MHTLGHGFVPDPIHAGGLRYHGMAPLVRIRLGCYKLLVTVSDPPFEILDTSAASDSCAWPLTERMGWCTKQCCDRLVGTACDDAVLVVEAKTDGQSTCVVLWVAQQCSV